MVICRLNRLGLASADLGLAVLDRFMPSLGLAQAGPDLKVVCFTFLMHVLYFWFPGRFWPGRGLNLAKTARPKPAGAQPEGGQLTSLSYLDLNFILTEVYSILFAFMLVQRKVIERISGKLKQCD